MGIVHTTGIADDDAITQHRHLIGQRIVLDIERNFMEGVTIRLKTVAVSALQHGVGFSLKIDMGARAAESNPA